MLFPIYFQVALRCTLYILQQQKRSHPKRVIDPLTINSKAQVTLSVPVTPGYRSDNEWLQYKLEHHATDAQKWDEPRFIHRTYIGFNQWPE